MPTMDEYLAMMQPDPAETRKQAMWQALGGMGAGLLSGRNWQQGLSRGGLLAYDAMNDANNRASSDKMAQMKMRLAAQEMADKDAERDKQKRMDSALSSSFMPGSHGSPEMGPPTAAGAMQPAVAPSGPSFDVGRYISQVKDIDPARALQAYQSTQRDSPFDKPKVENYTPASVSRYAQTRNYADLVPIGKPPEALTGKVNPSDFTPQSVKSFIASGGDHSLLVPVDRTPRTNINISNKLEGAESVAKGQQNVKYYGDIKSAADNALKENAILQRLISNPLETGAGVPIAGAAANWAAFAGLGGDKVKEYATNSQNFTRDTMELVMNRQLAQKGPQTESDAKRLESTVANAKNTKAANAAIAQFALAQNKRLIEQRKFYDKWWLAKKTYEGADEAWFDGRGGTSVWDDVPGGGEQPGALPDGVSVKRVR